MGTIPTLLFIEVRMALYSARVCTFFCNFFLLSNNHVNGLGKNGTQKSYKKKSDMQSSK